MLCSCCRPLWRVCFLFRLLLALTNAHTHARKPRSLKSKSEAAEPGFRSRWHWTTRRVSECHLARHFKIPPAGSRGQQRGLWSVAARCTMSLCFAQPRNVCQKICQPWMKGLHNRKRNCSEHVFAPKLSLLEHLNAQDPAVLQPSTKKEV